ncbi:MAG: argininosuccinate lyase [Actinomycetota bacterium]|nr:argininosuccinate lyase [Actinomycetota bacterium]
MKLWQGRFKLNTSGLVEEFTSSLDFDRRLYAYDIKGSMAHVKMLAKCDIITEKEAAEIEEGLSEIYRDIEADAFDFDPADEDIHMAIECALIDKIGTVGGKLHTARSRNDQVALDVRMYLKDEMKSIMNLIIELQRVLIELALNNLDVIIPGLTHFQHAQPVLLSHHLMAYFFMLERDFDRLKDCRYRTDSMPLGSGALAGTVFPIDRYFVAEELGFSKVSENSLDSVSDRDFIVEFLAAASLIMVHLSRLSEELIVWSSFEFDFIELGDDFTTGSSIMPQKKNPDVAELVRGKSGRVFGDLLNLLTTLKSLPLAYNRDLQEDKEALFDGADTVKACLNIYAAMLGSIRIKPERMRASAEKGFLTATDVADYLTDKGLPFRDSHKTVGEMVAYCIEKSITLGQLKLKELKKFSPLFEEDVLSLISVETSVDRRDSFGGTSRSSVIKEIEIAQKMLEEEKIYLA